MRNAKHSENSSWTKSKPSMKITTNTDLNMLSLCKIFYLIFSVMNNKEFIVYLIASNKITKVTYMNDFVIPCFSRWIEIAGNKLILTGGEKDYIESLSDTYMFKFRRVKYI
ncbi:MAG: hypothetical protein MJ252_25840 [archaeon]|nr:hypothetical protein [archaeon]